MDSELTTHVSISTLLVLVLISGSVGCGTDPQSTGRNHSGEGKTKQGDLQALLDEPAPELRSVEGYGFLPRACGFDLDDDGVVGEPEDCRICDGSTVDPDGDGVEEDLIYVSCDADGSDAGGCGSPDKPCATLGYAWANIVDGPEDGAEDILCFRGTCRERKTLVPRTSGVEGIVTVAASGTQIRDFERPKDPAMLVGWDADGDGEYPPFDQDDLAELDGTAGPARGLRFEPVADRFELAHFTVRGFGISADGKDSGFVAMGPGQGELNHLYFHDMHWLEVNKGRPARASVSAVDLFSDKTRVHWLWIENVWAPRTGGWWVRGSGLDQGPDGGPFRFQNLTVTARGCDFADCQASAAFTGFHLWGYLSGIEILDSHFDAGVKEWQPKPKGGPSGARFALAAQCSQDWTIRHNLIEDFKNAVRIQGWAERYCDDGAARTVGPVVVDRNLIRNTYEPWTGGDVAVYISEGGDDPAEAVGDVWVTHNVFSAPAGWESCVWVHGGNGAATPEGHITIANNTCAGKIDYHGGIVIGDTGGQVPRFPHEGIRVVNNLITGLRTEDPNLRITYPAPGIVSDHNVYDPAGQFHWGEQTVVELTAWQTESGLDESSSACLPAFVDFERGDYRLQPDDACAVDRAEVIEGTDPIDQAGTRRSDNVWETGALEQPNP